MPSLSKVRVFKQERCVVQISTHNSRVAGQGPHSPRRENAPLSASQDMLLPTPRSLMQRRTKQFVRLLEGPWPLINPQTILQSFKSAMHDYRGLTDSRFFSVLIQIDNFSFLSFLFSRFDYDFLVLVVKCWQGQYSLFARTRCDSLSLFVHLPRTKWNQLLICLLSWHCGVW